jgi:hypothetical protein
MEEGEKQRDAEEGRHGCWGCLESMVMQCNTFVCVCHEKVHVDVCEMAGRSCAWYLGRACATAMSLALAFSANSSSYR